MSDDKDYGPGLDRRAAIPALMQGHEDMLIVSGLAGSSRDVSALCREQTNYFTMAGAMGGATAIGLGLALAQPEKKVVVVTGDGELLMNVGSLAMVSVVAPPNLTIICVDNGHYQETGNQESHTSQGVDLAAMATGAGIKAVRTVTDESQIEDARTLMAQSNTPNFILLKVNQAPPPAYKRSFDAADVRSQFRRHALGHA